MPNPDPIFPGDKRLVLSCRKCTRQGIFYAADLVAAVRKALDAGWVRDAWPEDREQYVCPQCPSSVRDELRRQQAAQTPAAAEAPV